MRLGEWDLGGTIGVGLKRDRTSMKQISVPDDGSSAEGVGKLRDNKTEQGFSSVRY